MTIGNEAFTAIVDGPTELGATMSKDLADILFVNTRPTTADNAEVSVRTIRNLNSGTAFSEWSNTVTWIRQ